MGRSQKIPKHNFNQIAGISFLLFSGLVFVILVAYVVSNRSTLSALVRAVTPGYNPTQQQGSLEFPTGSPDLLTTPGAAGGPITGGPVNPNGPFYCIDDQDPDGCDDTTAFWVPKGTGGISGTCGTVIEQSHSIVKNLPQAIKAIRDSLNPAVSNTCHDTGTYSSGYISTFFVSDAYNLAGYHELLKTNPAQITGVGMLDWWRTAAAHGYTYNSYTGGTQLQQNLVGKTVFINVPSGVHVGIVNNVEIYDTHGNGVLSILQSGTSFYLDRFEIVNWQVTNTPLHQTQINGVQGFGGR